MGSRGDQKLTCVDKKSDFVTSKFQERYLPYDDVSAWVGKVEASHKWHSLALKAKEAMCMRTASGANGEATRSLWWVPP